MEAQMPARIQRSAGLVVRFFRDGEEVDARVGSTGEKALKIEVLMLAKLDDLQAGDRLTVEAES
jgi:hypothetical protein